MSATGRTIGLDNPAFRGRLRAPNNRTLYNPPTRLKPPHAPPLPEQPTHDTSQTIPVHQVDPVETVPVVQNLQPLPKPEPPTRPHAYFPREPLPAPAPVVEASYPQPQPPVEEQQYVHPAPPQQYQEEYYEPQPVAPVADTPMPAQSYSEEMPQQYENFVHEQSQALPNQSQKIWQSFRAYGCQEYSSPTCLDLK